MDPILCLYHKDLSRQFANVWFLVAIFGKYHKLQRGHFEDGPLRHNDVIVMQINSDC